MPIQHEYLLSKTNMIKVLCQRNADILLHAILFIFLFYFLINKNWGERQRITLSYNYYTQAWKGINIVTHPNVFY